MEKKNCQIYFVPTSKNYTVVVTFKGSLTSSFEIFAILCDGLLDKIHILSLEKDVWKTIFTIYIVSWQSSPNTTEPLEYSNIDSTNQLHFCICGTDGLKGNSRPVSSWLEILNKWSKIVQVLSKSNEK